MAGMCLQSTASWECIRSHGSVRLDFDNGVDEVREPRDRNERPREESDLLRAWHVPDDDYRPGCISSFAMMPRQSSRLFVIRVRFLSRMRSRSWPSFSAPHPKSCTKCDM